MARTILYIWALSVGGFLLFIPGCWAEKNKLVYCEAYCDISGIHYERQNCTSEGFCCGGRYERECCNDPDKDVGDEYPPESSCSASSWWYYQWRVIVGLLVTLIIMLVSAACCYYCCTGESRSLGVRRSSNRATEMTNAANPDVENDNTQFNPTSPTAFAPPDYESLAKDPPKYEDICGNANLAFEVGEPSGETSFTATPSERPPSYESSHDEPVERVPAAVVYENEASAGSSEDQPEQVADRENVERSTGSTSSVSDISPVHAAGGRCSITPIENTDAEETEMTRIDSSSGRDSTSELTTQGRVDVDTVPNTSSLMTVCTMNC